MLSLPFAPITLPTARSAARHLPLGDLQRRWSQLVECMGSERFAAIAARGSGTCDSGYYDKPLELPEYLLFKYVSRSHYYGPFCRREPRPAPPRQGEAPAADSPRALEQLV